MPAKFSHAVYMYDLDKNSEHVCIYINIYIYIQFLSL